MRKKLFISLVCVFILASVPLTVHAGVWQEDVRGYWYLNDDGTKPVGSWKIIDNKWYYFKEDGYRNTGWIKVSDQWYYCEPTGEMRITALQTDVFTFTFNADGTCNNFYQNTTPSAQAGWADYGTTSSSTLVNAIATGNVIYYNGSYWATPDYVSSLKNMRVVYENDNSNTSDTSKQEYQGYEGLFTNLEIIEPQTTENKFDLDGIS